MFEHSNIQIGIAPINWTNDDMPSLGSKNNFEQILSETALTGYAGTEIGITFPDGIEDIKNVVKLQYHLDLRNLKIASKWVGVYLATQDFEKVVKNFEEELKILKLLNADCINVCEMSYNLFRSNQSMFINKPKLSNQEWKSLCKGLNALGKLAYKYGIKLCYHHHMGTVVQTLEEITYLLVNTNSKYVHLCLDTGDLILADIEPASFIQKFGKRIAHIHLKDLYSEKMVIAQKENYSFRDAIRNNCFTVPGDGNGYINFVEIFMALDEINYSGWLIVEAEQDPDLANPFEYALKARYYLSAMLDL